jgi:uncharacterized protein YecE (DUF72 family)
MLLMQNHHPPVGCCGWCEAKAKYFNDFPVIELQSTFYELPSLALASRWRALAPPEFNFNLKAWQLITHAPSSPTYRKLKSKLSETEHDLVGFFRPTEQVTLAWERTADIARILRAKVVLFQCPASFKAEKKNIQHLITFFSKINRGELQLAWEPRGEWPLELVTTICTDLNLLHCVDPLSVMMDTIEPSYWRLHGKDGYSYRYLEDDLVKLSELQRHCYERGIGPQYIFFNNIWMKEDARRFQSYMRRPNGAVMGSHG